MNLKKTRGQCHFCKASYTRAGMKKHLVKCEKRVKKLLSSQQSKQNLFLLEIYGGYKGEYWLFIELSTESTLNDLDKYLRGIWLECCGHLSQFIINGSSYGSDYTGDCCQYTMNKKLKNVIQPGLEFIHEYDFGSTTKLTLFVVDKRSGVSETQKLTQIARNNPPEIRCNMCGSSDATTMCMNCLWNDQGGFLCDKCLVTHQCDEETYMPVVNSPRMGVCGYTG
jgi:hypothetical protein